MSVTTAKHWNRVKSTGQRTTPSTWLQAMGIDILTEEQYRDLQKLSNFDTKTSSWVKTPSDIRALGGALFCDRRYGKVFTYHEWRAVVLWSGDFRGSLRV